MWNLESTSSDSRKFPEKFQLLASQCLSQVMLKLGYPWNRLCSELVAMGRSLRELHIKTALLVENNWSPGATAVDIFIILMATVPRVSPCISVQVFYWPLSSPCCRFLWAASDFLPSTLYWHSEECTTWCFLQYGSSFWRLLSSDICGPGRAWNFPSNFFGSFWYYR